LGTRHGPEDWELTPLVFGKEGANTNWSRQKGLKKKNTPPNALGKREKKSALRRPKKKTSEQKPKGSAS